jgi:hypothetical protein
MLDLKNVNATNMTIMIAGGMKNMNSLLERLKPEYKAKLDEQAKAYPSAVASFIQELKDESFVMDLKYGTAVSLTNFLNLPDYNFVTISNLFES